MKPLDASTRLLGTPVIARGLYIVLSFIVFAAVNEHVPLLYGLLALAGIVRVRSATLTLRGHKAWWAEWNAMGKGVTATRKSEKTPGGRGRLALQAVAFAFVALAIATSASDGERLSEGQFAVCLLMLGGLVWVAWRFIAATRRNRPKVQATGKEGAKAKSTPDEVDLVLPPASSSPSRGEITRRLPEYAARLLG